MYIQISCSSPLWENLAAGIFFVVFVPALTLAIQHWLFSKRRQEEKKRVQQMTEKIEALHVSYAETINSLKSDLDKLTTDKDQKEQLIAIVIHDLKSPLRFLSMHMENLQENLKGMNPEELKSYTLLLKNTVNDVYLFTQEVLLWLNNKNDNFNILKKNTNIEDLINNTARLYQEICLEKNNRIEIVVTQNIMIDTAADLLNVIIRNLLDNANKFTTNGLITITAGTKDKLAYITVTDTGIGMTQEKCNELTNHDLNNWNIQASRKHLGYKIINDLIMKLGGFINIVSKINEGTSITVWIPVS